MDLSNFEKVVKFDPGIITKKDDEGLTPVHLAAISGNVTAMSLFLDTLPGDGGGLDTVDTCGHSAMHWATVCNATKCVQMLCDQGANVNLQDKHGCTPLHYAAQANNVRIVNILIGTGADDKIVDNLGRTPTMWSVCSGSLDSFLVLSKMEDSLKIRDEQGLSPLHCASALGHTDIVSAIIDIDEDSVNTEDSDGATPLFYAANHGRVDCVKILIKAGANVNHCDAFGRSSVLCGVVSGKCSILSALVEARANIDTMTTKDGDTCLHVAVARNKTDQVTWIVRNHPGLLNRTNKHGVTPLHLAANLNSVKICKLLLGSGCQVNPVVSVNGYQDKKRMSVDCSRVMTPVDVAMTKHYHGCAKLLQLHGGLSWTRLERSRSRRRQRRTCARLVRVKSAPAVRYTATRADQDLTENINEFDGNTLEDIRSDIRFLKDKIENLHIETSKQLEDLKPKNEVIFKDSSKQLNDNHDDPINDAKENLVDKGTDTLDDLQIITADENEIHNDERDKYNDDDFDDTNTVNSSPTARDSGFSDKHFPSSPDNSLLSSVHSHKISTSCSGQTLYRNRHHACFPEHYFDRLGKKKTIDVNTRPTTSRLSRTSMSKSCDVSSLRPMTSHYSRRPITSSSMMIAPQQRVRRFTVEKKIFHELLEMKKHQIRVGKFNEAVMVKRMSEKYNQTLDRLLGMKSYEGDFSFESFERHLYNELSKVKNLEPEKAINGSQAEDEWETSSSSYFYSGTEKGSDGKKIILPRIDNGRDHLRIYMNRFNKY